MTEDEERREDPADRGGEVEIDVTVDRSRRREHEPAADQTGRVHDRRFDADGERSPERRLADELGRIDVLTTPEGYVEGRVTALEPVDGSTVRLEVTLPHGEAVDFTLEKPIPWSREFLLARIVEDVGYDAASIGHLVGETVYVTRSDLEDEEDWLTASIRSMNDAVLETLPPGLVGRLGLGPDRSPQWRLVDPLEWPDPEPEGRSPVTTAALAGAVVLVGLLLAVAGAAVGGAGGIAGVVVALAYAAPGILIALVGLAVLLVSTLRRAMNRSRTP